MCIAETCPQYLFVGSADLVSEFAPAPPSPPVTELGGGPLFSVIGSMQPLPLPIVSTPSDTSPTGPLEQLEKYEGMRVQADLSVIAPTEGTVFESDATSSSSGVFYAVVDGVPRPVREPGLDPASPAPAGLPCCVPRFDGNPERLRVDSSAQPGSAILNVAAGQRISGVTGVLDFAFGSYAIPPDPGTGDRDRGAGSDAGSSRERNGIHGRLRESRAVLPRSWTTRITTTSR